MLNKMSISCKKKKLVYKIKQIIESHLFCSTELSPHIKQASLLTLSVNI